MPEMTSPDGIDPRRIVIVGGGVAALEAVLALHDLAETLFEVTAIAPEPEFRLRPLDALRPFANGHAGRLDLERFMREHGGCFRRTATLSVDTERRTAHCATGLDEHYDALIVAAGASARPAFEHALTFGVDSQALSGLLADLERGYSRGVAFVVPNGCTWPIPLYELALLTADEVRGVGTDDVQLHLVTPELGPLDLFGLGASAAARELLQAAYIELHSGVSAGVRRGGHVDTGFGGGLDVDRVVALPALNGPRLQGLPSDANGFIPIDVYGRVLGVNAVYAAGDATDRPIKQGGLACQQADTVAAHVAAGAGAPVDAVPYTPVLRGRLLTGRSDRFLRHSEKPGASETATQPLWWPPVELSGRYLAPYLETQGLVELPPRGEALAAGVDVRMPLSWLERRSVVPRA